MLDLAQWVGMQGFDRARPLWEMYLVDGMADGRSALIQKIHHAITDGVGSIQIALTLFDLEREPGEIRARCPTSRRSTCSAPLERLVAGTEHVARRRLRHAAAVGRHDRRRPAQPRRPIRVGVGRRALDAAASVGRMVAPATEPMSPVMTGRSLSVRFATLVRPLDDLRAAAKAADGKLNDAFVAAVAGGLHRYHEHLGAPVDQLRMTMPINVRTEETDRSGRQPVRARPLRRADRDHRSDRAHGRHPHARRRAARRAGPRPHASRSPGSSTACRRPITTGVFGGMLKGVDFVTSNVPGAPVPLYAAGAEIVQQFPFGPLSGAAANITLLSWLGQVCIGINVDPAAVADADAFHACLARGSTRSSRPV